MGGGLGGGAGGQLRPCPCRVASRAPETVAIWLKRAGPSGGCFCAPGAAPLPLFSGSSLRRCGGLAAPAAAPPPFFALSLFSFSFPPLHGAAPGARPLLPPLRSLAGGHVFVSASARLVGPLRGAGLSLCRAWPPSVAGLGGPSQASAGGSCGLPSGRASLAPGAWPPSRWLRLPLGVSVASGPWGALSGIWVAPVRLWPTWRLSMSLSSVPPSSRPASVAFRGSGPFALYTNSPHGFRGSASTAFGSLSGSHPLITRPVLDGTPSGWPGRMGSFAGSEGLSLGFRLLVLLSLFFSPSGRSADFAGLPAVGCLQLVSVGMRPPLGPFCCRHLILLALWEHCAVGAVGHRPLLRVS